MKNTHRSSHRRIRTASRWYAKRSAIGSSIATKARNCTCRAFPPRRKNCGAFSSLQMPRVRGSIRQVRSGKLNGDHVGLFKLRLTGPRDRIDSKLVEKESY